MQFGHAALNMLDNLEDLSLKALAKSIQESGQGEISQKFSSASQLIQLDPQLGLLFASEFGRRLKENASRGTDHGHGNIAWLCGPSVKGGEIFGDWQGLEHHKLFERSDLATTTDLRHIFHEVLKLREPNLKFDEVFARTETEFKFNIFQKN